MYNLEIENFKCFTHKFIPLNRLTVLAGANGNGKSTVIQALLFLRRTIEHCARWEGGEISQYIYTETNGLNVELNGSYCLVLGNSFMIAPRNTSPEFVSIKVIDEGIGIKQEDFNRIFTKFSRLDNPLTRKVQGSGLGLYITKTLVQKMHGNMNLVSSENGSTFELLLPVENVENQAKIIKGDI